MAEIISFCRKCVIPEDQNHFSECVDLADIPNKLKDKYIFSFTYRFKKEDGAIGMKLRQITWADKSKRSVVIASIETGEDVK